VAIEPEEIGAVREELEVWREGFLSNIRVDFHEERDVCLKELVRVFFVKAAVAVTIVVTVILRCWVG